MAAAERGSFLWFMFGITQFFLSIKLMGEVEGWVTTPVSYTHLTLPTILRV